MPSSRRLETAPDVDDTLCADSTAVWHASTKGDEDTADLILGLNVLGNSCQYMGWPRRIPVLEDNCEALGT
jgi:hypothetical protein